MYLKYNNVILHDRLEITGLISGLFAVAIHTIVDFNFYIVAILMVMGFMCARIQEISGHYFSGLIRDFIPAHKVSKKIFMLVAAVFPFVILSYSLPIALGDITGTKQMNILKTARLKKVNLLWRKQLHGIREVLVSGFSNFHFIGIFYR